MKKLNMFINKNVFVKELKAIQKCFIMKLILLSCNKDFFIQTLHTTDSVVQSPFYMVGY